MSSAGVTFWWFPDEEEAFLNYLQSTGDILAISPLVAPSPEAFHPVPVRDCIRQRNPDQLLIGPAHFACEAPVQMSSVKGIPNYFVSAMTSSLIMYRRGKFRSEDKLGQSNLSAHWDMLNEAETAVVDKNAEFKRWGMKILRWARNTTPEWHQFKGYRVTRRVKEAIDGGTVTILP